MTSSHYLNLLESDEYAELFRKHPPITFPCLGNEWETPSFFTPFDITMTMDGKTAAFLKKIPCFSAIRRMLVWKTEFYGTTVTEYAPIAVSHDFGALIDELKKNVRKASLIIIKDLPNSSPLLSKEINIKADELASAACSRGFFQVEGEALAYLPIDFDSTDDWLSRFSKSRRKDLKRKFRSREFIEEEFVLLGDERFEDPSFISKMYSLYMEVYDQSQVHFDCLSEKFFKALLSSKTIKGVCAFYSKKDTKEMIGWNVSLIHNGMMIDKFIGMHYPSARDLNLYFVSWLANIEYAKKEGLKTYVAGWTDSKVKASLGAKFTMTRHLAFVVNPFLRTVIRPFRHMFESEAENK